MTHVAECPCGRTYSLPDWNALPLVGHQRDEVEVLELRNCWCGSTRSVPVGELLLAETHAMSHGSRP